MTTDAPVVTLDDKYVARSGRVLLTGVQALVRLTLAQRRLDLDRGLDTRVLVSGYPGSPLGGLDLAMHVDEPLQPRLTDVIRNELIGGQPRCRCAVAR